MGPLAGGFAALKSAEGVQAFFSDLVASAKEVSREARNLGVSATYVQQLGASARRAGGDFEQLRAGIVRMQSAIAESALKTGPTTGILGNLKLDAGKLLGQSTEQQLKQVATAIMAIGNETLRTRAEVELFGRAGKQLESTLRDVATGGIAKYAAMSDDAVAGMKALSSQSGQTWAAIKAGAGEFFGQSVQGYRRLWRSMADGVSFYAALDQLQKEATTGREADAQAAAKQLQIEKELAQAEQFRAAAKQFNKQTSAMGEPGEIWAAWGKTCKRWPPRPRRCPGRCPGSCAARVEAMETRDLTRAYADLRTTGLAPFLREQEQMRAEGWSRISVRGIRAVNEAKTPYSDSKRSSSIRP